MLASIGVPLALGALGLIGQQQTNDANATSAKYATDVNAQQAGINRDWQANMSNTSHQREVADLKAAGLNPLLSGTGGAGASTPGGATATAEKSVSENALGAGITSATEGYKSYLAGQMQGEQVKSMAASRRLTQAQTTNADMDTLVKSKDIPQAEIKNELWGIAKAVKNKVEDGIKYSAKDLAASERFDDAVKQQNANWREADRKEKLRSKWRKLDPKINVKFNNP
nr:MAG: DNA pilot protein [Microvirus sp.]